MDELAFKAKVWSIFSKLDLKSGFWQIPVAKESERFLAFSMPVGRFCYCKLPMGLSASPEFFLKVLHRVLEGLEEVSIYVDDIVICTKLVDTHHC